MVRDLSPIPQIITRTFGKIMSSVVTVSGQVTATITLPPVAGGGRVFVKNLNSGALVVNSDATNILAPTSGTPAASIAVLAGHAAQFVSDGMHWNQMF